MPLERLTPDQLTRIASAGGGLRLDGGHFTADQLTRISSAASTKNARIVIFNAEKLTPDQLTRIASAGKGATSFE